jgi:hypothetical protein
MRGEQEHPQCAVQTRTTLFDAKDRIMRVLELHQEL